MPDVRYFPENVLEPVIREFLCQAGASPDDSAQTTKALLHASRTGVDSHGVRLAVYYARLLRSGRLNASPHRQVRHTGPATALLDADHGLAHPASYLAMNEAIALARNAGIGAVGVMNSTHFGAAGAYALEAAYQNMIGISTCNAESLVSLFQGSIPFHGTNPIAMAAPVPDSNPWLLDMATSSIPFNRVQLYRSLGITLPENVALDSDGQPTRDPQKARFLEPLGGPEFGFKGAALAGVVTLLSAILTGATCDPDIPSGPDAKGPSNIGHFFIALDPGRFVGQTGYRTAITHYLAALRGSPARNPDQRIMAPGDREWAETEKRARQGIPVDPDTTAALGL
ncbi:Ldh family oxidoreductase [Acetobacter musti]|uniref:Ldh family oxidoreductase n=1 Tax=Acetobacter musti TaxID=864732 RepID=A0ABX0JQP5_9PROT|nr:Ldh family oxidoreductase [Acetobacter musti]NHN84850.1 Ldh family oxidoreductase [Acetobacter musti]